MRRLTCPDCGGEVITSSNAVVSIIRCPHCGSAMSGINRIDRVVRAFDSTRCGYCGSKMTDGDPICSVCGCRCESIEADVPIESSTPSAGSVAKGNASSGSAIVESSVPKKLSLGTGILCFIIPFLGIILWWKDRQKSPRKAIAEILLSIYPSVMCIVGPVIGAHTGSHPSSTRNAATSQQAGAMTFKDWMLEEFEPYDVTSVDIAGGIATIYFNINDNLSEEMIVDGAKADVMYMLKDITESGYDYSEIRIIGRFPMIDPYGSSEIMNVVDLRYSRSTIDRIDWSGFLYTNTFSIADSRNIHPAFQR